MKANCGLNIFPLKMQSSSVPVVVSARVQCIRDVVFTRVRC